MMSDRTIEIGGKAYTIRFGQYALFLLEQASGKSVEQFGAMPNFSALYLLLYAGLECARLKYRNRVQPWTLLEVGELLEEAGGMAALSASVMDAFFMAFPQQRPALPQEQPEKNEQTQPEPDPAGTPSS